MTVWLGQLPTPVENAIARQNRIGRDIGEPGEGTIVRREIRLRRGKELLETVDDEIGLKEMGKNGFNQNGKMAEDRVEDVGLLKIIELIGAADEAGRGKAPVSEMREEHITRHQTGNRRNGPAGGGFQRFVETAEI